MRVSLLKVNFDTTLANNVHVSVAKVFNFHCPLSLALKLELSLTETYLFSAISLRLELIVTDPFIWCKKLEILC